MKDLLKAIDETERIAASEADWPLKYDLVFAKLWTKVRPKLEELGIDFDWYDPDTSYEEDVLAFVGALGKLKERLLKLPEELRS